VLASRRGREKKGPRKIKSSNMCQAWKTAGGAAASKREKKNCTLQKKLGGTKPGINKKSKLHKTSGNTRRGWGRTKKKYGFYIAGDGKKEARKKKKAGSKKKNERELTRKDRSQGSNAYAREKRESEGSMAERRTRKKKEQND